VDWGSDAVAQSLTKQEHLDLVALHHLVTLELVLNLLISLLSLLLLCAHSATHGGECDGSAV
jgi:hypothetical protein